MRFKFRCNILISGKIIKELPGLVGSGTPDIIGSLSVQINVDTVQVKHDLHKTKIQVYQIPLKFIVIPGFSKNTQISNFMKIPPVEAELFHANGQTDGHDEANTRFPQFCE